MKEIKKRLSMTNAERLSYFRSLEKERLSAFTKEELIEMLLENKGLVEPVEGEEYFVPLNSYPI